MALAFTLMILFGFLSAHGVGATTSFNSTFVNDVVAHATHIADNEPNRNAMNMPSVNATRDYILHSIAANVAHQTNIGVPPGNEDYTVYADVLQQQAVPIPTSFLVQIRPNSVTMNSATPRDERVVFVRGDLGDATQNVVVYIPGYQTVQGTASADVAVFSVRIDSIGPEATNAALIGSMIELVNYFASQQTPSHRNDLVFIFADGGLENELGLRTVLNQFHMGVRAGNAMGRVRFIANFDSRGNRGPMMLTDSGIFSGATISVAGNTGAQASSVINLFGISEDARPYHVAQGLPSLEFANVGGLRNERTINDNSDNLSISLVRNQIETMHRTIAAFGTVNLSQRFDVASSSDAVYFTYFNWFTISYSIAIGFVLAGLIIGLMAAVLGINAKTKSFSYLKVSMGAIIQLLAVVGGALTVFLVYALMALLLAGFGVITLNAFTLFSLINPGIIISAAILFCIAMVAIYVPLKKAFYVTAPDVVRGGVLVTALIAFIMAFALPSIAFLFAFLSMGQLAVMLASMLLKDKFKNKFGFSIERLFLYAWPTIIMMPVFLAAITTLSTLTPLIFLPLIVMLFAPLLNIFIPYADMLLKPLLTKVFLKLPHQHIRVEEEVTEMVEDTAKKGKFNQVTHKKISKEKRRIAYKNAYGIMIVGMFAFISMVLFSSFGGGFHSLVYSSSPSIEDYFWHGAFNLVSHTPGSGLFEVRDLSAHREISRYVRDMTWNSDVNAYLKTVPADGAGAIPEPTLSSSTTGNYEGMLLYTTPLTRSRIRVNVNNMALIERVYIMGANGPDQFDPYHAIVFENLHSAPNITFFLPFEFGQFVSMRFVGSGNVGIEVVEESFDNMVLGATADVRALTAEGSRVRDYIRYNVIFRRSTTITGAPA